MKSDYYPVPRFEIADENIRIHHNRYSILAANHALAALPVLPPFSNDPFRVADSEFNLAGSTLRSMQQIFVSHPL